MVTIRVVAVSAVTWYVFSEITQLTVYFFFIGYFIYQFSGVCLVHDPMKKEENGSLASSGSTTKWAT